MRNRGRALALDSDADRLDEARRRARRAGVDNLRIRAIPAGAGGRRRARATRRARPTWCWSTPPAAGWGRSGASPTPAGGSGPATRSRFAVTQSELVARFSRLVKPGGRLVYATCSIGRTENEEVAAVAAALPGLRAPAAREDARRRGGARRRARRERAAALAAPPRHRRLLRGRLRAPAEEQRGARAPRGRVRRAQPAPLGRGAADRAGRGPIPGPARIFRPGDPAAFARALAGRASSGWTAAASTCSSRSRTGAAARSASGPTWA